MFAYLPFFLFKVPGTYTDKVEVYEKLQLFHECLDQAFIICAIGQNNFYVKLALYLILALVIGRYLHLTTTNFSWWSNFCVAFYTVNIQRANDQDESSNHWQLHRLVCGMWRRLKDWLLIDSQAEIHTSARDDCQVQDRALDMYWGWNMSLWLKAQGLLYLLMLLVTITQAQNGPTPKWWNRVKVRVTDSCLWQRETSTHSSF